MPSREQSATFWAGVRARRKGESLATALEVVETHHAEMEADEAADRWNTEEDGPADDEWIHEAYLRQAGINDLDERLR